MPSIDHLLVIGTRPEALKCAPLIGAFERRGARRRLAVVFSGQQPGLFGIAFPEPDVDIRLPDWSHEGSMKQQRVMALERLRALIERSDPGPSMRVIVQGDTSTSYLAALAAAREGATVHHVEAGLRTSSITNPFPEEFHRRAIARMAHMHYAPTEGARHNLLREGVAKERILVTGNTGIDMLMSTLNGHGRMGSADTVLISMHRRENHGAPVQHFMRTVIALASQYPALRFIWVEHSHPGIARELAVHGRSPAPNIRIVHPLPYHELIQDSSRYALIMTDSGGLQEEAAHLGIPLVVLRDRTERPEALDERMAVLCSPLDHERVIGIFRQLIGRARKPRLVFGDGQAAERIADHLLGDSRS